MQIQIIKKIHAIMFELKFLKESIFEKETINVFLISIKKVII